jgi:hypothetical protein
MLGWNTHCQLTKKPRQLQQLMDTHCQLMQDIGCAWGVYILLPSAVEPCYQKNGVRNFKQTYRHYVEPGPEQALKTEQELKEELKQELKMELKVEKELWRDFQPPGPSPGPA